MNIVLQCFVYFLEFIKFFLIYKFILCLNLRKSIVSYILVISGIVGMAMSDIVLSEQYKLIVYIGVLMIIAIGTVQEKLHKIIIISLWTTSIISTLDYIVASIIRVWWNYNNSFFEKTMVSIIASLITILFLLIIIFRYGKTLTYDKINMGYYVAFSVLVAANAIALTGIGEVIKRDTGYQYKVSAMIIYLVIAIGVYAQLFMIISLAMSRNAYREKDELNKKYLRMEEEHYLYLDEREKNTKKFRHDIRNHMQMLKVLCSEQKYDELQKYIGTIDEKLESYGRNIHVNYGIANAILNQYDKVCQEKKIDFSVKGHFPNRCEIEAFDMCTIFSNLLSNAVEAAYECAEKKIVVDIRYNEEDDTIFIKTYNTYAGDLNYDGKKIITSKTDKENHGYGLQNIKDSVEKYGGNVKIIAEEGIFSVNIMMNNTSHTKKRKS